MKEPIISVSGLRGMIGTSLTPETVIRYVGAYAATLPPGPVVVTRDGRASGPMLTDAVRASLVASGRVCLDADVAATPTTGILVRQMQAAGGIQISASHNPSSYNGLKLFSRAGRVIPADAGQEVLECYRAKQFDWRPHDQLGRSRHIEDCVSEHLASIEKICDVDRIQSQRFRVLLDANHGAGSVLGLPLLERLGCEVTLLGGEPDGQFAHTPEPTAENLTTVLQQVVSANAVIGFCQDPDADRLAIIDESGRYLGEEYTPALCVEHLLGQSPGPVVTNCSTSRMTQDLAEKHGVPYYASRVGEANVVDRMLAEDAVLGCEGNGGVIDPRVGLVRDSFVGMALVLDAMAAHNLPVSALADQLPRYAIHKTKVDMSPERANAALAMLEKHFADATSSRLDGLRLDWPDRWLLVRASNTEPIVRVIAEAPQAVTAKGLCEEAVGVLAIGETAG
jgi:phosphomannomutase